MVGWVSAARSILIMTRLKLVSWRGAIAWIVAAVTWAAAPPPIRPAIGPHTGLKASDFLGARSFRSGDRLVGTYYFYWYDAESRTHIEDGDGSDALTTHPPTLEGLSWKSVAWHRRQLVDMEAAGIDVVLPVFWGAPSEQAVGASLHWSYEGLPPLVEAREALEREGANPPRLGLFYDTSSLRYNAWGEHVDLTTARGREWFFATIRDFFSLIPPRHWAMIDDRPIILLYAAAFAKAHDQGVVDHLRAEFPKLFGGRVPWLAREVSWNLQADSVVAWGGALGLKSPGVASLGPGYDHAAVPGRQPLVVDRRGGQFYEDQWMRFLRRPTSFVMVETWNEWHEGTDIAESREYGRQYIELTRRFADRYKQGWRPPRPKGPHTGAAQVTLAAGANAGGTGLRPVDHEDGRTAAVTRAGRAALATAAGVNRSRYFYVAVDDSFKADEAAADYALEVDYFDEAAGVLRVEYDGSDSRAPMAGAYSFSPSAVRLAGDGAWHTARFPLPQARLTNAQNGAADLRLVFDGEGGAVGRLMLTRSPSPP
jgi:hypothetical protein